MLRLYSLNMVGVLAVLLFCLGAIQVGRYLCARFAGELDPAAQLGIYAMVGLGTLGTLVFFVGLVSTSVATLLATFVAGVALIAKPQWGFVKFSKPAGIDLLFPLAIGAGLLMALAGVFAPSTGNDWDSLAYHLAVPKLWLTGGKIEVIPFIHQANFPFAVDSLFLVGLKWGGQGAAKLFVWVFTLVGAIAIFGLARQRYGNRAGWWSSLVFATVPIVLWQSGTGYIDVAHGLFAGIGLVLACWQLELDDTKFAWMSAIMLGFAAGTKYTGLQTIAVAGLVVLVGLAIQRRSIKPALIIGLAALALASPWYIKNAVWKGNPVFPFFYSRLGGSDWDQRRADIYTNEQNTFGVGREKPPEGSISPIRLGHSVLGLAYQPGRYVNPQQTQGGGDPIGAVGIAVVGALLIGLLAGQRGRFEKAMIAGVLLSIGVWFVLTQQSRYIVTLAVPLALVAGQATTRRGFAPIMGTLAVVQAVATLFLLHTLRFSDQMEVVAGKIDATSFQSRRIGFFAPAQSINRLGAGVKIALYDEVFGYLLNVPYYWANPGHGTMIPYDQMENGRDYSSRMKEMGFTHVYLNLSPQVKDPALAAEIVASLGGADFPATTQARLIASWEQKFNWLVVSAVKSGDLSVKETFGNPAMPRAVLLEFR